MTHDDWQPIARYGDTQEQVRAAHEEDDAEALVDLRRQLVESGMPDGAIAMALAKVWGLRQAYLDKVIPEIMESMLATAPAAGDAPPLH